MYKNLKNLSRNNFCFEVLHITIKKINLLFVTYEKQLVNYVSNWGKSISE